MRRSSAPMWNPLLANSYEVLADERFVAWNERTWSLQSQRLRFSDPKERVSFTAVVYLDRTGKLRQPPLTFYTPISFDIPDPSRLELSQLESAWTTAFDQFAKYLGSSKLAGSINLAPGIHDVRPFTWERMSAEVRYTYTSSVPLGNTPTHSVRKAIGKASKNGLEVVETTDYAAIANCLDSTGERKGFSYRLTNESLSDLASSLPNENLLTHVVINPAGDVVAGGARLITPGGTAIDWVQGTNREALTKGAAQAIVDKVLEDSASSGALRFDYGGANIRPVAKAKSSWNMELTPYYSISQANIRSIYHLVRKSVSNRRIRNRNNAE